MLKTFQRFNLKILNFISREVYYKSALTYDTHNANNNLNLFYYNYCEIEKFL